MAKSSSRSSSSSSNSGETKTPLVIALVFFILATLTLGVTTYIGFGDATKAREDSTKDKAAKTQADNDAAKANEIADFYRVLIGTATPEQRTKVESARFATELAAEQKQFMDRLYDPKNGAVMTALTKTMNEQGLKGNFADQMAKFFPWPEPNKAPPQSMIELAVSQFGQRQVAANLAATADKNYNDLKETTLKAIASYNEAQKKFEEQTAAFPGKIADNAKDFAAKNDEIKKKFETDMDKSRKEIQTQADKNFIAEENLNKEKNRSSNLENRALKAEAELTSQQDPFQYDKPSGKITNRLLGSKQVEIDLGSADYLKPGIKFSIQPSDTKEVGLGSRLKEVKGPGGKKEYRIQAKANIEVVEVIGPHLSIARITEEFDEVRDRVMKGDLLYNSAWRKGSADHIALIGIFDLDADGIDDIQFVINNLNKAGIVVDAYYDLASSKWVGKVTERTIFAVEGYSPMLKGLDGNADVKAKIISQIEDAKKYCLERGAKPVKIRDFFPRIGYDVNLGITDDRINQAAAKYYSAGQPAAPKEGDK